MKRALGVALLILISGFAASADTQENTGTKQSLTLTQARVIARQALYAGRFDLARDVAMVLVRVDPEDAYAYGVLAAAHSRLKDPKLARAAARLSYKYSETPEEKFGAARTAASIAYQQNRPTLSQMWLRLAATHSGSEEQDDVLAEDYKRVRAANPLYFNIRVSVAPSDNVNNGTDNVLLVVDGVSTNGAFDGSSRALSGTVGTFDARLRYRLAASQNGRTTATGRLYFREVDLSSEARSIAPDAEDGDFASAFAETGIEHIRTVGAPGNTVTIGGAVGASWYGGERSYDFAKLSLSRGLKLSKSSRLSINGTAERRFSAHSTERDVDVFSVGATLNHKLERGDSITLGLTVQDVSGDFTNADYQTASLRAYYSFGRQLGPVKISTGLTFGYTDYDDYQLINTVESGRQDESLYGDISFFFADYDVGGFAPTVRLRTGRRSSNVNRFDIEETTISLGIQSKF